MRLQQQGPTTSLSGRPARGPIMLVKCLESPGLERHGAVGVRQKGIESRLQLPASRPFPLSIHSHGS